MLKFLSFKGSTSLKVFWLYCLAAFLFAILSIVIIKVVTPVMSQAGWPISSLMLLLLFTYFILGLSLIPMVARRLHDVGYSGWCMFIPFYRLYLLCLPGTENKGADPKNKNAKNAGLLFMCLWAMCIPFCGGLSSAVVIPGYMEYRKNVREAQQRNILKEESDFKAARAMYEKEIAALDASSDVSSDGKSDK